MIGDVLEALVLGLEYFYGGLWIALGIATTYGLIKLAVWNLRRSRWFKGKH